MSINKAQEISGGILQKPDEGMELM